MRQCCLKKCFCTKACFENKGKWANGQEIMTSMVIFYIFCCLCKYIELELNIEVLNVVIRVKKLFMQKDIQIFLQFSYLTPI